VHFRPHTILTDAKGGVLVPAETGECLLKLRSAAMRLTVYKAQVARGLVSSTAMAMSDCPVAQRGKWADCPHFGRGLRPPTSPA
jgi:hypothetical protein